MARLHGEIALQAEKMVDIADERSFHAVLTAEVEAVETHSVAEIKVAVPGLASDQVTAKYFVSRILGGA